jgi:succinoglycan biosynthesis protein ExoO
MPPSDLVSVVMAFRNGAPYLRDAVFSVLAQTHRDVELLLCDDASTDESPAIAEACAASDPRVRVLRSAAQGGPGAARNLGLHAAQGDWIAVVDADDLIHPRRIEGLLAAAAGLEADVVADDLVRFGAESGTTLLAPMALTGPWRPDARALLRAETGRPAVPVGYLKPMIRREALGPLRYREFMTVGEDLDLLLRVLMSGARAAVLPRPWYLYRRHRASVSHRLGLADIAGMERALDMLRAEMPEAVAGLGPVLDDWRRLVGRSGRFAALVAELKARDMGRAGRRLARDPRLALPLARAAMEGARRRLPRGTGRAMPERLTLTAEPAAGDFTVPERPEDWDGTRAAALTARTGSGRLDLRAVGKPGLEALGYVPGWRLAELVAPRDGWTEEETRRIAAMPWPVRLLDPHETSAPQVNPAKRPATLAGH